MHPAAPGTKGVAAGAITCRLVRPKPGKIPHSAMDGHAPVAARLRFLLRLLKAADRQRAARYADYPLWSSRYPSVHALLAQNGSVALPPRLFRAFLRRRVLLCPVVSAEFVQLSNLSGECDFLGNSGAEPDSLLPFQQKFGVLLNFKFLKLRNIQVNSNYSFLILEH